MSWLASPAQLFSYYPKYEYLDNLLSTTSRKKMKLYIDFKGCAVALFQKWAVESIISQSQGSQMVDTSLFAAVLEFISYHKKYAIKRNIDLDMYFFMESGSSSYHKDVYKDYKSNRGLTDFFGLDDATRQFFFKILDKNYTVTDRVVNRLPHCYFFRMLFLEADFMPWYLMKHQLDKNDVDDSLNIIYSNDKDMYQCLDSPNIYQFCKNYKNTRMVSGDTIYLNWLKEDIKISNAAEWFPMSLAVMGDAGDGFAGVKGIGPVTFIKLFEELRTLCGYSMKNVYENIRLKKSIFAKDIKPNNKHLQDIIDNEAIVVRNLKLASYHLLSEHVNGGFPTDMIEKKKVITECVSNSDKWKNAAILNQALTKSGMIGVVNDLTMNSLFTK